MKSPHKKSHPAIELRWRPHDDPMTKVRVWRNDWGGDQFEILSISAFNQLRIFCNQFAIPVMDYSDED